MTTGSTTGFRHRVRTTAVALCVPLVASCGLVPGTGDGSADPVTVMTWAPQDTRATDMPGMPALASAYARAVNAGGGIDGHELRVLTCDERNTRIGAARCARRAVEEGAVAVVGSYSQHADASLPVLEAAGIPYIGGYGLTPDEFAGPLTYPVNGGQAALLAGSGVQLSQVCRQVALVRPDTVAGDALPPLIDAGLAEGERAAAADIRGAEDGSDFTAQADQALAAAGADPGDVALLGTEGASAQAGEGCVMAVLGERTDTFFDSFRRRLEEGQKVRVASVLGSVGQSLVDRTGGGSSPFEGAYVTGWYPVASDARWAPMRRAIRTHAFSDNRIDPADAGAQTTWIAYEVLRQAIVSLKGADVTADALTRTLDDGLKVDTGGLTPPLEWSYDRLRTFGPYLRVSNTHVTFQRVREGRLVAAGRQGFVDVTKPLDRADIDG